LSQDGLAHSNEFLILILYSHVTNPTDSFCSIPGSSIYCTCKCVKSSWSLSRLSRRVLYYYPYRIEESDAIRETANTAVARFIEYSWILAHLLAHPNNHSTIETDLPSTRFQSRSSPVFFVPLYQNAPSAFLFFSFFAQSVPENRTILRGRLMDGINVACLGTAAILLTGRGWSPCFLSHHTTD
jgi:hypothetical protein